MLAAVVCVLGKPLLPASPFWDVVSQGDSVPNALYFFLYFYHLLDNYFLSTDNRSVIK